MKYSLVIILSLFSISLFSQNDGFKIKKITFQSSEELDMVSGLDYDYFVAQIPDEESYLLKGVEFGESDLDAALCENPSIGLEFALVHSKFKNIEWRNNINYIHDRIDAVTYNNYNRDYHKDYSNISFTNYHDELSIESSIVYDLKLGPLHFYGGAGTNIGISFNDEVRISGQLPRNPVEATNDGVIAEQNQGGKIHFTSDISNILTQRIFVQGGLGLDIFKKIELGLEFKKGIGYRTIGTGVRLTNLTGIQLRLGYRL